MNWKLIAPEWREKGAFIICECGELDHSIFIMPDLSDQTVSFEYSVTHSPSFWVRLWRGLKYIFGCYPRYWGFNDTWLNLEQFKSLTGYMLNALKELEEARDESGKNGTGTGSAPSETTDSSQ